MKEGIILKRSINSDAAKNDEVHSTQIFTYLTSNTFLKRVEKQRGSFLSNNLSNFLFKNNQHPNFLYVYFWFAYYLLFVPFRFQKIGEGKYEIYQWLPQKVLCGFSTSLSILKLITTLRSVISNIRGGDPISYFLVFCETSSLIFKLIVYKLFWKNSLAFEKLINFLNCPDLIPYNPYKIESIKSIALFCGSYSALSFLRLIFGSSFIEYSDWSPVWIYRRLVAEGRYTFFISNANATNVNTAPTLEEITPVDTFIAILQGLSAQSRFITGFFADLCILVHVFSLWAPSSGFTEYMHTQLTNLVVSSAEKEDDSYNEVGDSSSISIRAELEMVLRQFDALKRLSILIGESFGDVLLPFLGEALFYYATNFDTVVTTPDLITRFVLMFFYTSAFCILMFSAEIVRQMRWFKIWLADQRRLAIIDQNKLSVVLDDLATHSVGITASGVFTIHYSFVGTVVSVLITYFIIRLQTASMQL